MLAVARVIAWSADRHTGRSRPTLARIVKASRLCLRTVQRWCRFLEQHGLLTVLEPGVTAQYRPALLALGADSLAREWRLTLPLVSRTVTPPFGSDLDSSLRRRAREAIHNKDRRCAADSTPPPSLPQVTPFPLNQKAQRRRGALAAAQMLRAELPVLRRMSARAVRSALRVYFRAGWTVLDVRHALEVRADGTRHIQTTAVHSPARWLAQRLGYWLAKDGTPRPPHSAELGARAERHRAGQAARREQLAAMQAQVGDYAAQASRAREMLAARKARSK
jgi:hypothetical protein